jgi:hypothetical protein
VISELVFTAAAAPRTVEGRPQVLLSPPQAAGLYLVKENSHSCHRF